MADQKPDEYMGYLPNAEFFAIVSRGAMGFRFGPYTAEEAGEIMKQATDEGCPVVISAVCGREFDWELARDLRGWPADRFPMADAPRDGRSIIADWNGIECEAQWDRAWGVFRLIEKGEPSTPIAPLSWRWPETADIARAPETPA